ncbi:hypothetical protein N3K66_006688 [Trichothecium roseum]|uniref:Uncharacterized protein n=1 Tax=Trichothecium roseum TaxID=47278 RepID=A0ACC0UWP3_9HYPO|nr:hypothetical protein N3K66_006688 [Trichothecium roseum]
MAPQQHPAARLMLIVFIFWMVLPDGESRSSSLLLSDKATLRLGQFRHSLDVLNQTHWGDFAPNDDEGTYMNLTGFRREDGFAWDGLERFRNRSLGLSRYANPQVGGQELWDLGKGVPVWTRASGTVRGDWVRKEGSVPRGYDSYNLSSSVPLYQWVGDKDSWARNITGPSGRITLNLEGNETATEYDELPDGQRPIGGGLVRDVNAMVTVDDPHNWEASWEMRLWGAHWPKQGVILLTTTSEKFDGIFGLPHLTPGPDYFKSSQLLLNQTLADTIAKKEQTVFVDPNIPWSSETDHAVYTKYPGPHCEFILYAQLHTPAHDPLPLEGTGTQQERLTKWVETMESELEHPLGAPIGHVPHLQMSAIVYSPDCSFFLETKGPPEFPPGEFQHLVGVKKEVHVNRVKTWLLINALVFLGQLALLRFQIRESSTPSTTARISFGTMSMMTVVDAVVFVAAICWAPTAAATFLPTLALVFSSGTSAAIGLMFLAKIHEVQLPEARPRRERPQATAGAAEGAGTTPSEPQTSGPQTSEPQAAAGEANEPLLPEPVTARRQAQTLDQPIIVPSDQDVDAEIAEVAGAAGAVARSQGAGQADGQARPPTFQSRMGRMMLIGLIGSFIALTSIEWWASIRSVFLNIYAFLYLSLWVPQIRRNTMRNCRRPLSWYFICGQSLMRLTPIAYFWLKKDNFLYARTEPRAFAALGLWVWIQIFVLTAQAVVGPRFGIPSRWLPEAWDYHPILREDNIEAGGLPIGLVVDESPDVRRSDERARANNDDARTVDCSICHESLEVPVVRSGKEAASGVAATLARRAYMVTPCRHVFHTACLEGWMRFRLQCPICREELPPL